MTEHALPKHTNTHAHTLIRTRTHKYTQDLVRTGAIEPSHVPVFGTEPRDTGGALLQFCLPTSAPPLLPHSYWNPDSMRLEKGVGGRYDHTTTPPPSFILES